MKQFWLWNASVAICNHLHMSCGPNQPWSCSFLAKIGDQLGRKCCGWLVIPCIIPIPVVMILACEPISTLEYFCICLQSCTRVIWVRVALELDTFGQIWGQLGRKWCVWVTKTCAIPIPGFVELSYEPALTLECFCSSLWPYVRTI